MLNGRTDLVRTRAGRIPKPVKALGVVSFLTDVSSEMIYPLLPVFLTQTLGAGVLALGIIEGVAESTASLLKVVSGVWADRSARRKPFIVAGYGLAGLVRPLIGLAMTWPFVLGCRFVDRVGKGIRTAPRDALIADVTAPAFRGQAYGFHRMMDHAGAVAGPLIAALLLKGVGLPLRTVFLCSTVPALAVVLVVVLGVREPERHTQSQPLSSPSLNDWRRAGGDFKLFLFAVVLFTLGNSTDAFILLRLSWAGVDAGWIAVIWSLHHVVKSLSAYLGGAACDKWGPRRTLLLGWTAYAGVYAAFAFGRTPAFLITIFLLYGVYYGLSEPSERAWVAEMAPARLRGSYMGLYHGAVGLAALPASVLFGVLWKVAGVSVAFLVGAGFALAAAAVIVANRGKPEATL